MRTLSVSVAVASIVFTSIPLARAQDANVSGTYEVKYEEVSTNCGDRKLQYTPGKLKIEVKAKQLMVDIDRTPAMYGVPAPNGKVSAKSRSGDTMMGGMKGVFSVAGRITPEGQLHLVMVGEYSVDGKPLCTQSWNVSGPRMR